MAKMSTLVFDKTGTLTRNQEGTVDYIGKELNMEAKEQLRALTLQSKHPKSRQIAQYLAPVHSGIPVVAFQEQTGAGISGRIDGVTWKLGSKAFILGDQGDGVYVSRNDKVLGHFDIRPRFRSGLTNMFDSLRKRFGLYLLSGDNDREKQQLAPLFPNPEDLHFQQSPADKLRFIQELQDAGEEVLMLGDGLNDAGALKQSNVGIVLAENTNNFTPASDAILDAEKLEVLPRFLAFARGNIRLVFAAYLLALVYNVIGLSFAVQGTLSPVIAAILMPTSSLSIVLFGVLSSNWLAWKMGLWEGGDKNH